MMIFLNYLSKSVKHICTKLFGTSKIRTMSDFSRSETKLNNLVENVRQIFKGSVSAVDPATLVRQNISLDQVSGAISVCNSKIEPDKNVYMVGFGKAVCSMAVECHKILRGRVVKGIISVPQGSNSMNLEPNVKIYEGAKNNLPDENALRNAELIVDLAQSLTRNDVLIVLISGGGSGLAPMPVPEISLIDKINTIKLLATVGADITELNTVRKKLSVIKGGGLAELAYPAQVYSLIISDIINDPIDFIASGPTEYNSDSDTAALEVIQKYKLELKLSRHVLQAVMRPRQKSDVPVQGRKYTHVQNNIVGNNALAIEGAVKEATSLGFCPLTFSSQVEGLVFDVARVYAHLSLLLCELLSDSNVSVVHKFNQFIRNSRVGFMLHHSFINELQNKLKTQNNVCIIAGGETTVLVQGNGKGGRSQELTLWFSQIVHELKENNPVLNDFNVLLLSAGTDGIDGPTDVAGAVGGDFIINTASQQHLNVDTFLANNDSYNLFSKIENGSFFVKTGHTGTNVMDLHVLVISKL